MKIRKRSGPNTVPWGIPDVIADLEDLKIYDNFITSRKFKLL